MYHKEQNSSSDQMVNEERIVEERTWVEEFPVVLVQLVNKNALLIIDATLWFPCSLLAFKKAKV